MKPTITSNFKTKALITLGALSVIAVGVVWAQSEAPKMPDLTKMTTSNEMDDLYFNTKVGSFKILPRGNVMPSGSLSMTFTGSVLISGLEGDVQATGSVRREYWQKEHNKEVWFGTGKLVIKGKFLNVQWFGRDLNAELHGNGILRLYGEFDKNLDTGYYWFDKADKKYWGNYGTTVVVPEQKMGGGSAMTRDEFEKNKKGKSGG